MFEFLKGFEKVTVEKIQLAQFDFHSNEIKYYCQDENDQLTHLLVENSRSNEFLTELLTGLSKSSSVSHLRFLALINCQLKQLPPPILALTTLIELDLRENQLTTLPADFAKLSQLQGLDLRENQLSALPDDFSKLSQLCELYLSNNQLSALPTDFAKLSKLQLFFIANNPISDNIHQLANELPPADLIAYLLEIQKPQTKSLNEAKVLVLGDERVGKTSLINRLLGNKMDENQQTTLGIDIQQYQLSNGININIWDFAGQEITHQTHQFFLSHRSLYLLVLDGQKQDNDADISKWLNTIKSTAGADAPIVVVVNKCDLNLGQFDLYRYKADFNIVDVIYTSAADNSTFTDTTKIPHSIADLIEVVSKQVEALDEVRLPFPPNWLAVKNALEAQKQDKNIDFIESAIYEQLCHQHNITAPDWQDALLTILNQIGTIVTYKDDERLNSMQIINPIWVTNGVYKILRSPLIKQNEATLNQCQFKQVFAGDAKYSKPRHYTWLIDLLKQFRLAFSLNNGLESNEQILLPARLATNQPEFDTAHYRQGLNFRFVYKGLLKPSTISQFIVYMNEYISQNEPKYWRRGVFLSFNSTGGNSQADAVVISDEEQKTITIGVNQSNRAGRDLLTIIRHGIRKINGKEAEVEEQVPLVLNGKLVGFESYDGLLDYQENDVKKIRAKTNQGSKDFHWFEVDELLDGYRIKDNTDFDYAKLTKDLFTLSCLLTESRNAIMDENEDLTNDRFKTGLQAKEYSVSDQSRGGQSASGLQAGERDLVIRNSQTDVVEAIIEAFVLKHHDTNVINSHLEKLVKHYDTTGNQHNYVLVYVKTTNFHQLWEKYKALIDGFEDTSDEHNKSQVLTGRSTHGPRQFTSTVNHVFIGFA